MVSFMFVLGNLELLAFFATDFVFAKTLNDLKRDHPVIDDCAPQQSPDLDAGVILNTLKDTASELYVHQLGRLTGERSGGDGGGYESVPSTADLEAGGNSTTVEGGGLTFEDDSAASGGWKKNGVHVFVVCCGIIAPILTLLQLIAPSSVSFARFGTPTWLQLVAAAPGLGIAALYVSRTLQVVQFYEVTRSQWLSLMWFRLDLLCILSALALVGLGCWLLTLCMLAVVLYLAHRLLLTEKRLTREKNASQLLRREVDLQHVYPPGTVEAQKALGNYNTDGYKSLS